MREPGGNALRIGGNTQTPGATESSPDQISLLAAIHP